MATTIRLGHASISENNNAHGAAGDSTGKEVYITENYSITKLCPTLLLRPLTESLAAKSAAFCEAVCANDNVGYSQSGRDSLYTEAQKVDFNGALIATKCNTDCSAFMTVCAIAGGSKLDYAGSGCVTNTMKSRFSACGDYKVLTDNIYFTSTDYLQRGDILVRTGHPNFVNKGHTVMVLDNGSKAGQDYAMSIEGASFSIIDNNYFRIIPKITSITANSVSAKVVVVKTVSGEEKQLEDKKSLSTYTWKYQLYSLTNANKTITKKLTVSEKGLDFSINNLSSSSVYILKLLALQDSELFACSTELLFTTPSIYPQSVKNLKIDLVNNFMYNISFDAPTSWPSTNKGYRISLLVNSKVKAFSDILITADFTGTVNRLITLKDLTSDYIPIYEDSIQLGIQTWIKDDKNNLVFDSLTPNCSQPVIITAPKHTYLDRVHLRLDRVFKRVLVYNRKDKE